MGDGLGLAALGDALVGGPLTVNGLAADAVVPSGLLTVTPNVPGEVVAGIVMIG